MIFLRTKLFCVYDIAQSWWLVGKGILSKHMRYGTAPVLLKVLVISASEVMQ